jgi:hypothetical protein
MTSKDAHPEIHPAVEHKASALIPLLNEYMTVPQPFYSQELELKEIGDAIP